MDLNLLPDESSWSRWWAGWEESAGGEDGCNVCQLCPNGLSSSFNDPLDGFLFCLCAAGGPGSHTVCQHALHCRNWPTVFSLIGFLRWNGYCWVFPMSKAMLVWGQPEKLETGDMLYILAANVGDLTSGNLQFFLLFCWCSDRGCGQSARLPMYPLLSHKPTRLLLEMRSSTVVSSTNLKMWFAWEGREQSCL